MKRAPCEQKEHGEPWTWRTDARTRVSLAEQRCCAASDAKLALQLPVASCHSPAGQPKSRNLLYCRASTISSRWRSEITFQRRSVPIDRVARFHFNLAIAFVISTMNEAQWRARRVKRAGEERKGETRWKAPLRHSSDLQASVALDSSLPSRSASLKAKMNRMEPIAVNSCFAFLSFAAHITNLSSRIDCFNLLHHELAPIGW